MTRLTSRWPAGGGIWTAPSTSSLVIDVLLSEQRDTAAARRFFTRAPRHGPAPVEVTTDKAGPYLRVLDELIPTAMHVTAQSAPEVRGAERRDRLTGTADTRAAVWHYPPDERGSEREAAG